MNIEEVRDFCLSLPYAREDCPFGPEVVAFRLCGKIFAMLNLKDTSWFVLKCDPEKAVELRETHSEIRPAWHMNKRHWNQIDLSGNLADSFIEDLIRHSYELVTSKLTKKERTALFRL